MAAYNRPYTTPTTPRDPAAGAEQLTPTGTTPSAPDEIKITRGLYIGTGGILVVVMANGQVVVFKNVASGCVLPIQVRQILASSVFGTTSETTTCDDIVGLY